MIQTVPAQQGIGFELPKGGCLKVIDPQGGQVADLFCFAKKDHRDALSSGRSIDYEETLLFTTDNRLYSSSGVAMLSIVEDTCGRHDFLLTPCSLQMFQMIAGNDEYHPSCEENLRNAFLRFDIDPYKITTTFNLFMNVEFDLHGKIQVKTPISRAGDFVVFQAEMDLIVGLTACSDEGSNGGKCTEIAFEVYSPDSSSGGFRSCL